MNISKIFRKPSFIEQWTKMLRDAMSASGKGYRYHSLRNTGKGSDRRGDKVEKDDKGNVVVHLNAEARRYAERYKSTPMQPSRKAIARRRRAGYAA